MNYNNKFGLRDLFQNRSLANVFPQLGGKQTLLDANKFVLSCLKNVLNARVTDDNTLLTVGKHANVLRRVHDTRALFVKLFNSMPIIAQNMRTNTKLYTTFASRSEIAGIKSYTKKVEALRTVLNNIQYNPDFQSPGNAQGANTKRQEQWKKRVGYKE